MAIAFGVGFLALPTGAQDLRQTAHDLRSRLAPAVRDETAICVFCHAPAGSRAAPPQTPRWQSIDNGNAGFETYAAPMSRPGDAREADVASVICLSCHDASQAPNISGGGSDHPFGVPYGGGSGGETGGVWQPATIGEMANAQQRRSAGRRGFRTPRRSVIDQRVVWWVATSADSGRRTRSDLPLYGQLESARTLVAENGAVPTIECATCHDPHVTSPMFLRVSNAGSRLCLSCHDI